MSETQTGTTRRRQALQGVVVQNKMDKTVVVQVARVIVDPLYHKYMRRRSRFMAHDEKNECRMGDTVKILESRPLSKHKRWRVSAIVTKSTRG